MIRHLAFGLAIACMTGIAGQAYGQFGQTLDEREQFCETIYQNLTTNVAAQPDVALVEEVLRDAQANANRIEQFLVDIEESIGQIMALEEGPNMQLVGMLEAQAVEVEAAITQAERILDCWSRIFDIALDRQPSPLDLPGQAGAGASTFVEVAAPYRAQFEAVDAIFVNQGLRLLAARNRLEQAEILVLVEPQVRVAGSGPSLYARVEAGFEFPTDDPSIGETQWLDLGTGGGLAGEIGVRFPLDDYWSLDVGGRIGWSSMPIDAIINQGGGTSPLSGDDDLLTGLLSLRINRHFDSGIDLFGDVGIGVGDRRMDVIQNGAVVFDKSTTVFVWEIGGGANIDLCDDCGVAAGIYARYRDAEGFDANTQFDTLAIGGRQSFTVGGALIFDLGYLN